MKSVNNNKKTYNNNNNKHKYVHIYDEAQSKKQFENITEAFIENIKNPPNEKYKQYNHDELEVRFSSKPKFTKIDYDNVIKKLKSLGFKAEKPTGDYLLRIFTKFLATTGDYRESNVRIEIDGLNAIQSYCNSNSIEQLLNSTVPRYNVKFNKKSPAKYKDNVVKKAFFDNFNFRVAYDLEEGISPNSGMAKEIIEKWYDTNKTFRYLNRVKFYRDDLCVFIDVSIVKSSSLTADGKAGFYKSLQESNVFNNEEFYEIEIEVDTKKIQRNNYTPPQLMVELQKSIKYILAGLQGSNFPIALSEKQTVGNEYMRIIYGEEYNEHARIKSYNFIGPSSYTLQVKNIVTPTEESNIPNIRSNFAVTEKADGQRHLMFVASTGKIYLIDMSMNVIFTGALTENQDLFNSIFDGELILHDKNNIYINKFAIFDIYYINNKDVRHHKFILPDLFYTNNNINDVEPTRYTLIMKSINALNPKSIIKTEINPPINIIFKRFYCNSQIDTYNLDIFVACNQLLKNSVFEYNTDGLIFTHMLFGVGSSVVGRAGKKEKVTWEYSFKWKPVEYNTIDFLVTTKKNTSNQDEIKSIFENGNDNSTMVQLKQYKTIILKCGYDPSKHGYLNPCEDVMNDELPVFGNITDNNNNYLPVQFYPSNPSDENAGISNMLLKQDENNDYQMFSEENEVFKDNTIVEFKYDITRENGWKWVPLRVRYDKTSEYLRGVKNYGNAYNVANTNWHSIHNPITVEMITTGSGIPEEVVNNELYYNRINTNTLLTKGLRDFHNLYVKRLLILSVAKPRYTLIDYACAKGGDFPKWIDGKYSFIFGIDIVKDNLENRIDGACSRYLEYCKQTKIVPKVLFVNGDSTLNIKSGEAMLNPIAKNVTKAIFASDLTIDPNTLGKAVRRQVGIAKDGFNVSSCQFCMHYFFKNVVNLNNFIRNVSECTKQGGYFIGTAYDGLTVFNKLRNIKPDESIEIFNNGVKIWKISKKYNQTTFDANDTCLGYKIEVYQESINTVNEEYLINFEYFNSIMEKYGFRLLTNEECKDKKIRSSSGLFSELYAQMTSEAKNDIRLTNKLGNALNMAPYEKEISFLNRYFIYIKTTNVDAEQISKNSISKSLNYEKEEVLQSKKNKQSHSGIFVKLKKTLILRQDKNDILDNEETNINKSMKIKNKTKLKNMQLNTFTPEKK